MSWQNSSSSSGTIDFQTHSANDRLVSDKVTFFDFYPTNVSVNIIAGYVYNYVIEFSNGDSVSGSLIAQ